MPPYDMYDIRISHDARPFVHSAPCCEQARRDGSVLPGTLKYKYSTERLPWEQGLIFDRGLRQQRTPAAVGALHSEDSEMLPTLGGLAGDCTLGVRIRVLARRAGFWRRAPRLGRRRHCFVMTPIDISHVESNSCICTIFYRKTREARTTIRTIRDRFTSYGSYCQYAPGNQPPLPMGTGAVLGSR